MSEAQGADSVPAMTRHCVRILTFVHIANNLTRMSNKTDFLGSFAKGLCVIECFGADTPKLAIGDVSKATGLDRATARRCLLTLETLGYADYDGKFFSLTPRVLRLGMGALASLPMPRVIQPWLDQLSEQIGHSCSATILDETDIVFVARAAQRRIMSINLMLGSRLPAHSTGMGRVLLAALAESDCRKTIEASDLTPQTPRSLTDPSEIMTAIAEVREQGFAFVDQEVEIGLRSLAVPIFDQRGRVVAAINIGVAAIEKEPTEIIYDYLPILRKVQDGLKRVLG